MDITAAVAAGTAIAGLLAPFIVALINQPHFSAQTKRMIALGVGIVLAVIALAITGGFAVTPAEWGVVVLAVVGVSQALYAVVLKPTGVAESIERATSRADE